MNDTINSEHYQHLQSQIDSLKNSIQMMQIKEDYFNSNLSHQSHLFTTQTAIFVGIIIIVLTFVGLISWKAFFQRLQNKVTTAEQGFQNGIDSIESSVEKKLNSYKEEVINELNSKFNTINEKLTATEKNANEGKRNALRGLYEQNDSNNPWKIIWHLRYLHTFDVQKNIKSINIRLKALKDEYDVLKRLNTKGFEFLRSFDNLGGILKILQKFNKIEDTEIKLITNRLIEELTPDDKL